MARLPVDAELHTCSPRGVHGTRLSGGRATATEQRFGPHQPLANTHPAVIMAL